MDKNAASNECHEILDININQLEGASLSLCENKNPHQDDENQRSKDREKQESIESLSLTLISTKDEANIQPIKGQF